MSNELTRSTHTHLGLWTAIDPVHGSSWRAGALLSGTSSMVRGCGNGRVLFNHFPHHHGWSGPPLGPKSGSLTSSWPQTHGNGNVIISLNWEWSKREITFQLDWWVTVSWDFPSTPQHISCLSIWLSFADKQLWCNALWFLRQSVASDTVRLVWGVLYWSYGQQEVFSCEACEDMHDHQESLHHMH